MRQRLEEATERVMGALDGRSPRPLTLVGPSGCGKTRLLRELLGRRGLTAVWTTALDATDHLVDAIRTERLEEYQETLATDSRPLVIEHLEYLRGRELTRDEIHRLLDKRARQGHPVICTLTSSPGTEEVDIWLQGWTDRVELSRGAGE